MRKLAIAALIFVGSVGAFFAWYKFTYPTYTYRYRMTVEVEVDGQRRSGSSVIEVRLVKQSQFLIRIPPVRAEVAGEAVFVDLGEGRNVIALLASEGGANVDFPAHIVPAHFKLSYDDNDLVKYRHLEGSWELDPDTLPSLRLPTLISLGNLNDPSTVRIVHPYEFPKVFGWDVKPARITIAMTKDVVTRRIEPEIPVILTKLREKDKTPRLERAGDPFAVNSGHFERGR